MSNSKKTNKKISNKTFNRNIVLKVCKSSGCKSLKSLSIIEKLNEENKKNGSKYEIKETGCFGLCEAGPLVVIEPDETFYTQVNSSDASEIISSIKKNKVVDRLLYSPNGNTKFQKMADLDFYKFQTKYLLRRTGEINPLDIKDFIKKNGFKGLKKALSISSKKIIDAVIDSGLRGRGGGGFPTGKKWSIIANKKSPVKYIVANADEGDPGSFMDRILLEGDPFALIEGMAIAAYAIGSSTGIIYIRAEYPEAVEILENAISESRKHGYLGKNVCGKKGFNFDIKMSKGSGAYVCGEETALMNSVEGKRGVPRIKPPFPADYGINGHPTNINNVKTYAYVSHIIREGTSNFKKYGTEKSPGTAVLSLTGKVNSTGIVEVPMGTSLRTLVYDIGDGLRDNKEIKAVMTGGPSGGVIPASMLDLGVDYESLISAGSIMGSGGVLVFDEDDSMPNIAKFFVGFTKSESCGKCVPCREGTFRLYEMLQKITDGEATSDDLDLVEELCYYIKDTSACGLGQAAPNPVLTTLRYFRSEYEGLLKEKGIQVHSNTKHKNSHHTTGTGQHEDIISEDSENGDSDNTDDSIKYFITDSCTGCGSCVDVCPENCIKGNNGEKHIIDENNCIGCGSCLEACPVDAIVKK